MRRFSIGRLMLLVAFVGANFGAVRFLLSPRAGFVAELLAGFLPLLDAILLAAYFLARHNRIRIGRRDPSERGRFAVPFLAIGTAVLLASAGLAVWGSDPVLDLLDALSKPVEPLLNRIGMSSSTDTPYTRYIAAPVFLGVLLSGPPLLLALVLAFILSRFKLVVTPREEPCADSRSSA